MVALDKSGTIFLDSHAADLRKGNFADREYFQIHRDAPGDIGLYISKPFRARLQQSIWSISISRRLANPDGSFRGIVSGTVKLDYFKHLFDKVALGHHGSISLFRNDGLLLVRNIDTMADDQIGADWRRAPLFRALDGRPAATFQSTASMDGVPRLYAYHRVGALPLTIAVGVSLTEALAPFWAKISVLAGIFAAMAASVLALVWLLDGELRRREMEARASASLARIDGLTALGNRRRFDETLPQEWGRAAREARPLSLVMIDIDQFKIFNDRYGHPEGDRVLAAVANAIAESIRRPGDLACRYGGEEFTVLLPDTSEEGAALIAEAIRENVASLGIPHAGTVNGHVTVSLGTATAAPSAEQAPSGLVAAADAALYRAKDRGRNRVVASNVVAASFRGRADAPDPARKTA
jgi:diguanylate cyclase (GGDEF)-like protein